jgi:hypothetical protein
MTGAPSRDGRCHGGIILRQNGFELLLLILGQCDRFMQLLHPLFNGPDWTYHRQLRWGGPG